MYIISVKTGLTTYNKLCDDAPSAKDWLDARSRNLAAKGWEVDFPTVRHPGQFRVRLTKGDITVDATAMPADEASLKSVVSAPDWMIKLMLRLSPN
ncbi:MAG TPA: hypothetical protein VL500_04115 [Candidatus Eisenbacteria bacterium]|nr:hypothetical protein [Candidatus Eisenbacteria bacterium]